MTLLGKPVHFNHQSVKDEIFESVCVTFTRESRRAVAENLINYRPDSPLGRVLSVKRILPISQINPLD